MGLGRFGPVDSGRISLASPASFLQAENHRGCHPTMAHTWSLASKHYTPPSNAESQATATHLLPMPAVQAQQALCPFLDWKLWWLLPTHAPWQCQPVSYGTNTAGDGQASCPFLTISCLTKSSTGTGGKVDKSAVGWRKRRFCRSQETGLGKL